MGILLNIRQFIMGYNDTFGVSNNPLQKAVDWGRQYLNISGDSVTSDITTIAPGESITLFDGVRSLPEAIALPQTLSLKILDASKSLYRLSLGTGAGKFRSSRAIGFSTTTAIKTEVNNNSIMTIEILGAVPAETFTTVQVGDVLRIRGPKTGDNTNYVFSPVNSGTWTVLSKISNKKITVKRPAGEIFEGVAEASVTIGATLTSEQLMIYSSAGVQNTDSLVISGTLSPASFGDYSIKQVTPTTIDFVSGNLLPEENDISMTSASDIMVYFNAKKLVFIEVDQNSVVQFNGQTDMNNKIRPVFAGDEKLPGWASKWGHSYKCVIINESQIDPLTVKWIVTE